MAAASESACSTLKNVFDQWGSRAVVLGVGGGIAAYKVVTLLRLFTEAGHDVTVVPTQSALRFVGEPTWAALSGKPVKSDVWQDVHQVPHVQLGRQAELVVVAPATADVLARAAHGRCDDLLTAVLLTARCPVLMVPAMHTEMWEHPATVANVATLRGRGVHVLDPAVGRLTGADEGPGRLPEPGDIAFASASLLLGETVPDVPAMPASSLMAVGVAGKTLDLSGRRVVITAGGTREPLDPVRFIGNRSSGRQGYALAATALARGAEVTLISTVTDSLTAPAGVTVYAIDTAAQLHRAVIAESATADVVVMAAAVADFRPAVSQSHKIKKDDSGNVLDVRWERTTDILAEVSAADFRAQRPHRIVVGFAAETGDGSGDVMTHARAKLTRKGCDVLVVNDVSDGKVFGADTTTGTILNADGSVTAVPLGPKTDMADAIWDVVCQRWESTIVG
ncbi:MAG: bifunctional phosphopantothenoylcysteine decarboxylase/phosphopantothenate synthase [Actinomycetota bacterium]